MKQSLSEDDGYSSSVVKGQFPDTIEGSRESRDVSGVSHDNTTRTSSELDTINRPKAEKNFETEIIREQMMTSSSLQNFQNFQPTRILDKAVNKLENQHFIQQHLLQKQLELWVSVFILSFLRHNFMGPNSRGAPRESELVTFL